MHCKLKSFVKCNWHPDRKEKWLVSKSGVCCYLFTEYFQGTRESVFIKGLLVYKCKHINVGHWGHPAKSLASNGFCLLFLNPRGLPAIPWRACPPTGVGSVSSPGCWPCPAPWTHSIERVTPGVTTASPTCTALPPYSAVSLLTALPGRAST